VPTGPRPPHEVRVGALGAEPPVSAATVRATVRCVLTGERVRAAVMSVTHLSGQRMRALNRRTFGRDRATDVIAFGMQHGRFRVGDVYVCPSVATRNARERRIPVREEMIRLVVHGTLHALGHDHPGGDARLASPMWRRQERYVQGLLRGGRR
jgi:probable rRNA maturation factor